MPKLNVLVAGSTGYIGVQLIKLLVKHKHLNIKYLCGNSSVGKKISYYDKFFRKKKLPKILENVQGVDIVMFADAANIWGVDYDSSLDEGGIRSSIGLGLDWLTPIGPLTFSFAQPITKESSDIEETFRFNIGTSF